ncbi:hypothetical protein V1264_007621 [Littorina saxatilis]|uniref:Reverse transcriptase domain-containing protein n=3 Tax=Littorina saxatilis TaxID=31220 RepID=A0AAN9AVQ7_9CAEN
MFHNLETGSRGICLYIHSSLKPSPVDTIDSDFEEHILAECKRDNLPSLLVGLVYRSPNSSKDNNEKLNSLLVKAAQLKHYELLIMGDFNYPEIDWDSSTSEAGPSHPATSFVKATKDAFLVQHQKEPTRFRPGQKANIVDLVLTSEEGTVEEISTTPGMGKSDHFTLIIDLSMNMKKPTARTSFNYAKMDADVLTRELGAIDWKREGKGLKVEEYWTLLKGKISSAVEKAVPKRNTQGRRRQKWMDGGTLTSVRTKHKLFRRWLQTKSGEDYTAYVRARNRASAACRRAKKKLEKTVAKSARTNPKAFWSYVKSKTSTRSGVGDLKKEDGNRATTDRDKAELLNTFFQSVFTNEDDGPLPQPPTYNYGEALVDFDIKDEEVKKKLQGLKTNKAGGPDGISPLVLSTAADSLAHPVAELFRRSLAAEQVPGDWKRATVTPIFKKGSRLTPGNYRPVSLTCILCKVMEGLVRERVMKHLAENNLIHKEQHGFVAGRSCVTQLLDVLDAWTEVLDDGGSVDIIYTDFMKAFDSVPHKRLLSKVAAHGIQGKVLRWVESFLTDRTQCVVVNGASSQQAKVTSGVPQGSVCGPLLFVIYINDLPEVCSCPVRLFADDTKVYTRSDTEGGPEALQHDLDSLQQWSDNWLLRFHPDKCHTLKLGNKKSEAKYFMKGKRGGVDVNIELQESEVEKDLGVHVDNRLSFKEHVSIVSGKANQIVGVIRRTFDYLTEEMFIQLYKSLVRPKLEYGHSVWQPHNKTLCAEVENVQRRATKLIPGLKDEPYCERLKALKLPSLEHRRLRGDMIDTFKYVHGMYEADRPHFEPISSRDTRGHSLKLGKDHCRLNVRSNYFSQRVVNTWNSLPEEAVTAPSVNSFKTRIDNFWRHSTSMYNPTCLV